MDWLKDKKNLPFVIGGASVLILGAVAFLLFNLGVFNQSAPAPTAAPPPPPVATAPVSGAATPVAGTGIGNRPRLAVQSATAPSAAVPGVAPAPGAAAGTLPAPKVAAVDETKPVNPNAVHDPFSFYSLTAKASRKKIVTALANTLALPPVRGSLPPHDIYSDPTARNQVRLAASVPSNGYLPPLAAPRQDVTLPRVAGILYDGGSAYAILQPAYGQALSAKPGDAVPGVGSVTSIQSDSVTLKTTDGKTVQLPVSAAPAAPAYPSGPGYPGQYPGGGAGDSAGPPVAD